MAKIMPEAILPVKRPETDPGPIPRRQRDLVALRLHENKRQESAAGFKSKQKNAEIFCRVQIQDLIVDVIPSYRTNVRIGDASGEGA
jgi:hypothetical protein